jgi:hypothetical protein
VASGKSLFCQLRNRPTASVRLLTLVLSSVHSCLFLLQRYASFLAGSSCSCMPSRCSSLNIHGPAYLALSQQAPLLSSHPVGQVWHKTKSVFSRICSMLAHMLSISHLRFD